MIKIQIRAKSSTEEAAQRPTMGLTRKKTVKKYAVRQMLKVSLYIMNNPLGTGKFERLCIPEY